MFFAECECDHRLDEFRKYLPLEAKADFSVVFELALLGTGDVTSISRLLPDSEMSSGRRGGSGLSRFDEALLEAER